MFLFYTESGRVTLEKSHPATCKKRRSQLETELSDASRKVVGATSSEDFSSGDYFHYGGIHCQILFRTDA